MNASISLGIFELQLYSIIFVASVLAAALVAFLRATSRDVPLHMIARLVPASLFWMLILGRLLYVILPPPSAAEFYDRAWYFSSFTDLQAGALAIWAGGLSSSGLLLGVAFSLYLTARRCNQKIKSLLTVVMPSLLIAVTIGALANVPNQDFLGPPTNLVWGIAASGPPYDSYDDGALFHPIPIYQSLVAALLLMAYLALERSKPGQVDGLNQIMLRLLLISFVVFDVFILDVARIAGVVTLTQIAAISLILWLRWQV